MINERTERHINKIVKLNSLVDAKDQQILDLEKKIQDYQEALEYMENNRYTAAPLECSKKEKVIDMQHKELVSVTEENERLKEEVDELDRLIEDERQQKKYWQDWSGIAEKEIKEAKEEAVLLRSAEKMAWKQVEKSNSRNTDCRNVVHEIQDRIIEAKDLCWRLYDGLLTEEDITEDMKTDLRIIIDLLHD